MYGRGEIHLARQPTKKTTGKSKRASKSATRSKNTPRRPAAKKPPPKTKSQSRRELGDSANGDGQPQTSTDELLKAANTASGTARNAWLAFLGLIAYLLVTIAGVTHTDLLLNSPIKLPIVNVEIPLFSFFLAAPFLLLLVHLGLLVQHAMLAHKFSHFSNVISASETGNSRDHPDRRQVNSYVFSQLLAGPKPPLVLQYLMRLMVFVTLSLLPVLALLYFQIKFLPYHDVAVTHIHRLAILLDLVLLFSVRPFIAMPYLRPAGRKLRFGSKRWPWELSYWSLGATATLSLAVLVFSLLVATVPQGCFWPFGQQNDDCFSLDRLTARWAPAQVGSAEQPREVFAPTKWLFEGDPDPVISKPTSWFARNIVVTDTDLVPDKDDEFGEVSISLRGRDLRFAVLDRSDLHLADLTGADLRWTSLFGIRLDKARLENAELQGAFLQDAKLQGADLTVAELQGAYLRNAKLQGANLRRAELQGATLIDAELQGADLRRAKLQGADLSFVRLQGAYLRSAELQGADLRQAELQGAYLTYANLQGANLRQAELQGAYLRSAELQGANLTYANLQGANLDSAKLQGADLRSAGLQGADLISAGLQGADLRSAGIWQTRPPADQRLRLADLRIARIMPLTDEDRKGLQTLIGEGKDSNWGALLKENLEPLMNAEKAKDWDSSAERQAWVRLRPDPAVLSDFLATLACGDDTSGYIAKGIARRGLGTDLSQSSYNGDLVLFARNLSKKSCVGAKTLDSDTRARLCKLAAWPEDEIKKTFCAP